MAKGNFSVFLKGIEVEENLTQEEAMNVATDLEMQGYMDVEVVPM